MGHEEYKTALNKVKWKNRQHFAYIFQPVENA